MTNRIDWQGLIIPRAKELIGSYSYRPTLRQIFYRLVALLLIPDTKPAYKSFSRALTRARERKLIDPGPWNKEVERTKIERQVAKKLRED